MLALARQKKSSKPLHWRRKDSSRSFNSLAYRSLKILPCVQVNVTQSILHQSRMFHAKDSVGASKLNLDSKSYATIPSLQDSTQKFRELLPSYEKNPRGKSEVRFLDQLFPQDQRKILIKELEIPGNRITAQKRLDTLHLEEKVATIYALIECHDLDKAEKLMHQVYRLNKVEAGKIFNQKIFNRFIELFLQKQYEYSSTDPDHDNENELRAQEWYVSMQTDFNSPPNSHTFALFVAHYLKLRRPDQSWEYIEKMIENGFTIDELRQDIVLEDELLQSALQTLLNSRGFDHCLNDQSGSDLDSILESALMDTFALSEQEREKGFLEEDIDEELEELKPMNTLGVKIIKSALNFRAKEKDYDLYERQSWLETRTQTAARNQFMAMQEKIPESSRQVHSLPPDLLSVWHKNLLKKIEEGLRDPTKEDIAPIFPFLKLVAPEAISKICIAELIKQPALDYKSTVNLEFGEVSALRLANNIAESIEREHNLQQLNSKKNLKLLNLQKSIHKIHSSGKMFNMALRKAITKLASDKNHSLSDWKPDWGVRIKTQIGSYLLQLCLDIAQIPVPEPNRENDESHTWVPALSHEKKPIGDGWFLGVIKVHPYLFDLISSNTSFIASWSLPMLVPPVPWLTYRSGGYLTHRFPMVRTGHNEEHRRYIKEADQAKHLETMKMALDALGTTPWVVNKRLYEVAAYFWNRNIELPCLPAEIELPEIPKPEDFETNAESARKYKREVKKRQQKISSKFSDRCSANYKLEIAKSFLDETIYFPHNVDFRGRAYPIPPHLNHMGDDLSRGLLLFKECKPLGENGFRWLKIHISNLSGYDKASLDERVSFCEQNLENVLSSARDPMAPDAWWRKGDNPWQLLAACFDMEQALSCEDPTKYESNLHIHQDGSCNGLQHYAALGGDTMGARAVNLAPSDRPGDVYSAVARIVQKLVDDDCEKGVPEALLMKKRINRKLVKQTVMTNTYGVTFIGAKDQILNRLKEARVGEDPKTALTDEQMVACATYSARMVFASMGQMFEGARQIQVWLNNTASIITKSVPKERLDPKELAKYDAFVKFGLIEPSKDQQVSEVANELSSAVEEDAENSLLDESVQDCAKPPEIIKLNGKSPAKITSMTWTTPLGFPIVQPYRKANLQQVKTFLQTFSIYETTSTNPVNSSKQASAFPPNFVHSLDASHMMITAVTAKEQGLTFAAVHDSYWTHAADVETMNQILREAFIQLHSRKIMNNLRQELMSRNEDNRVLVKVNIAGKEAQEKYTKAMNSIGLKPIRKKVIDLWVPVVPPPLPSPGSFNINEVRNSKYFFH